MRVLLMIPAAMAITIAACAGDSVGSDGAPLLEASRDAVAEQSVGVAFGGATGSVRVAAPAAPPASGKGEAEVSMTSPVQFASDPRDPAPSMIIRTAHASVEVDSLERAIAELRSLAMRVGGYVSNTVMQGGSDQHREASIEVKIPSNRFEDVRSGLLALGELKSLNEAAQDVGEEYVDIEARVANSHRLEDRLVALLATRTGRLEDVLSVERELARVRAEIERAEGRLRYLRARVSFSTLAVSLFEPRPVISHGGGRGVIAEAFEQAWRNFVGFIAAIIATLGVLIPLAILVGLGWLGVNAVRRRFPAPTPPMTQ